MDFAGHFYEMRWFWEVNEICLIFISFFPSKIFIFCQVFVSFLARPIFHFFPGLYFILSQAYISLIPRPIFSLFARVIFHCDISFHSYQSPISSTLNSPTYSSGLRWTLVYVTKSNKFVTYCSPPESSGVQQTLVDSSRIWWNLVESGGIRWTEFELSHV